MKNKKIENNKFDIIVVGAGSGGLNIAGFMNSAGFKVLLIDKTDENIGGDCLNTGCVPSKALIHVAQKVKAGQEAERFFVNNNSNTSGYFTNQSIDIKKVTDYIKNKQNIIREHENADYFRKKGMTVVLGAAKFHNKNSVKVNDEVYSAKKIILATGSRPREFNLPGINENTPIFTNENIFDINFLPKHLVVIGGGPIGVELAQAFKYLGSEVTILAHSFLSKEDPEISSILLDQFHKDGIRVFINSEAKKIEKDGTLIFTDDDGVEKTVKPDAILSSVGRKLNVENLNLEKAGIELNEKGKLKVDEYLRTTNKNILTIGDVAGNFMFTHAAELHASVIINNFFSPFKKKFSGKKMSWVTYVNPEIATFGLSEADLKGEKIKYEVLEKALIEDDRAIVENATKGKLKVFVTKSGRVLGGTMIAKNAGELVQELILLNSEEMDIDDLANKIYPYPTATRVNRSLALSFLSRKMTPFAKKIFKLLY